VASTFEALLLAQTNTLMPNGPVWLTYTPAWTATTTNPTLGNGTIAGRYYKTGHLICFSIYLAGGSTTTGGSGNYSLSLPVTPLASGTFVVGSYSGTLDHSGVAPGNIAGSVVAGSTAIGGPGTVGPAYIPVAVGTSGVVQWSAGNPFAISGANFVLHIAGMYESNA
jgi:hypothetical protein